MAQRGHTSDTTPAVLVTDPVCGMRIDPDAAAGTAEHEGHRYYFCSGSCQERFLADPARFANDTTTSDTAVGPGDHDHSAHHGHPAHDGGHAEHHREAGRVS